MFNPPHFCACFSQEPVAFVSIICFLILVSCVQFGVLYDVHYHWTSMYICLEASWRTTPGVGVSRCIEDLLVTICCCLFNGRVVVSLTHSPFPFSILFYTIFSMWRTYQIFSFDFKTSCVSKTKKKAFDTTGRTLHCNKDKCWASVVNLKCLVISWIPCSMM